MTPLERRLLADRRELSEAFDDHTGVTVEVQGDGLEATFSIQIEGVVTAALDPFDGQPVVVAAPMFVLAYPADYPRSAPLVRGLHPVFHPAVSDERSGELALDIEWAPSCSIVEVVTRAAALIQFVESVGPDAVVNETAAAWVVENEPIFPLGTVDVAPVDHARPA